MVKPSYRAAFAGMLTVALVVSQAAFIPFAHAASYITLSSFSGNPGETITVSGGGTQASGVVNIYVGTVSSTPATSTTSSADGSFSTSVKIPDNAPQGPLSIIAVDAANTQSSNSYYVVPLQGSITYSAASHAPFATVTVNGTGFAHNETVSVVLGSASSTAVATATGSFSTTLTVPMVTSGLYTINATGLSSGANGIEYFWIDGFYPSTSPSSYYLLPGQTLSFSGSGFAPNETITVTEASNSTVLSTFTADATGAFLSAGSFALPVDFAGSSRTFNLTGSQSHGIASTGLTVGSFYAYASPSAYWILPGSTLTFSGGGFAAGETVSVYFNNQTTPATTFTVGADGTFIGAGSVSIPLDSAGGSVSYTLIGNMSHAATSPIGVSVGSFYPSISPSEYYVQALSTVTVTGSGFAANEPVTVTASGSATSTEVTASPLGTISASVVIPFNTLGYSTIKATGSLSKASASVDVTLAKFYPSITPSAYYVFPGASLSFTGMGFAPNESVTITSGTVSTTTVADAFGTFTTSPVTVPYSATKSLNYSFTGALSNATASSDITVGTLYSYLTSDAYSANPGQTIHVTGFNFAPHESVTVSAGSLSTTTTADASGNTPAVALTIPFNAGTNLHVVFTGASTGVTSSLDVTLGAFYASLSADNYYVAPGSVVNVTGTGFAANEQVVLTVGSFSATTTTNALGNFTLVPVTLPYDNPTGSATIVGTGVLSGATSNVAITLAPFTSSVSPSTWYTGAGSSVTFTGAGFAANENVGIMLGTLAVGSTTADATGAFIFTTTVPHKTTGTAHYVFTGATTHSTSSIDITIAQIYSSVSLSTYYAQGGAPVTISGTGYASNESITITVGSEVLGTTTANATGSFSLSTTIPFQTPGDKVVTATGNDSGATGSSSITIAPVYTGLSLASYAGAPGTSITFIGSGYLPNEPITVSSDRGNVTTTFTADASGNFSDSSFTIPADMTEGNLVLTVTGTHSFDSKSITFYVTGK